MTRVGWIVLAMIVIVTAAFLSMTRCGGPMPPSAPAPRAAPTSPTDQAATGRLLVPVEGVAREAITDNWGDPRDGGGREHRGIDIMAGQGTPVLAVAPGRIEKLFQSEPGGTTLYLRSHDRGWIYYYAHLAGYAPGVREGQEIRAGDRLGFVGDTGNAGAGNYHLHFGMQRVRPEQRWWEGEDVNPYPQLAGRAPDR